MDTNRTTQRIFHNWLTKWEDNLLQLLQTDYF